VKIIKSTNDVEIMVDDEDYEFLNRHNWYVDKTGYVRTVLNNKQFYMHRLVFGKVPSGMVVDHADRNKLNNTKSNLRVATHGQNSFNIGKVKGNGQSEYIGIQKRGNSWRAYASINNKDVYIGASKDEVECARMRDAFVYAIRGEYAYLNFQDEIPVYSVWKFPTRLNRYLE